MARKSLSQVIDTARHAAEGAQVSVRHLVEAMGRSSIAAMLLLPALVVVSPVSGIPGVSIAGGLVIALIAAQITLGRRAIWLPEFILRLNLPGGKLRKGLDAIKRPAEKIDGVIHRRRILPEALMRHILGGMATAIGLVMPFLELIPFTSSIAAAVVATIALAMLAGDGLLGLAAIGLLAIGISGAVWLI